MLNPFDKIPVCPFFFQESLSRILVLQTEPHRLFFLGNSRLFDHTWGVRPWEKGGGGSYLDIFLDFFPETSFCEKI